MSLFISDHRRPQAIWTPAYQIHVNGVRRVTGLIYVHVEPPLDAPYLTALFGFPPTVNSADELRFETPRKETFTVLSQAELARRYGRQMGELHMDFGGHGVGMQMEVENVARYSRLLLDNGVPHEVSGRRLVIAAAFAAGIGLELLEPH